MSGEGGRVSGEAGQVSGEAGPPTEAPVEAAPEAAGSPGTRPSGMESEAATTCGWCGSVVAGGAPGDWSFEAGERGRAGGWLCPACTREHVRSIEGKLSADWW